MCCWILRVVNCWQTPCHRGSTFLPPHRRRPRFQWLLEQLVRERSSNLPGASLASDQLAQLLFIQIVRAHLGTSSTLPLGWLRALADARIAPALRSMHSNPGHAWGLEELADTDW